MFHLRSFDFDGLRRINFSMQVAHAHNLTVASYTHK
jgi:hypothetical protein